MKRLFINTLLFILAIILSALTFVGAVAIGASLWSDETAVFVAMLPMVVTILLVLGKMKER